MFGKFEFAVQGIGCGWFIVAELGICSLLCCWVIEEYRNADTRQPIDVRGVTLLLIDPVDCWCVNNHCQVSWLFIELKNIELCWCKLNVVYHNIDIHLFTWWDCVNNHCEQLKLWLKSRSVVVNSQQRILKLSVCTEVEVKLCGRLQLRQLDYILSNLWYIGECFVKISRPNSWCEGSNFVIDT